MAGHRPAELAVDGRSVATLDRGRRRDVPPAPPTAGFVRFARHHFHQILKAKFGLADR